MPQCGESLHMLEYTHAHIHMYVYIHDTEGNIKCTYMTLKM